jgi:hypothetical protein
MLRLVISSVLVLATSACVAPNRAPTDTRSDAALLREDIAALRQELARLEPAPQAQPPAGPEFERLTKELAKLKEGVSHLENRVGHLESDVSAASADNELTEMTIDSAGWDREVGFTSGVTSDGQPVLLCHVVEWRGYGKMKRFTRLADSQFVLEAEGYPSIEAHVAVGGVCDDSGSSRFVVVTPRQQLQPQARYQLHPRNQNETYRWVVQPDVVVAALGQSRK